MAGGDLLSEPGDRIRPSASQARRRWAAEVTQALREKNLSINAAARAAGISPGRLQAWLNQDVEPSPRVMPALARTIGRGHLHLLQLLDWLPADLADIPWRMEATTRLTEAMADAQRWLAGATQAVALDGGSLVAGALSEADRDWQVVLRRTMRGRRHPVRYATQVAVCPAGPASGCDTGSTESDRAEVERLIGPTMRHTGAFWEPPQHLADQTWTSRPDLVLTVPVLCASRPRGLRPDLAVPPAILVVGIPGTGVHEVAALLAQHLDWAYVDLAALATDQYGYNSRTDPGLVEQATVCTARRVLRTPSPASRRTVWALGEPTPILHAIRDLGPDLPLVVQLRGPESLLAAHAGSTTDVVVAETAQNLVRRTLLAERDKETFLIHDLPDLPGKHDRGERPVGAGSDPDTAFDTYVDSARQAAQWLHDQHSGPDLDVHGPLHPDRGQPPGA